MVNEEARESVDDICSRNKLIAFKDKKTLKVIHELRWGKLQ